MFVPDERRYRVMREEDVNPGVRIVMSALMHTPHGVIPIPVKVDAAYGDPIMPGPAMSRMAPTCRGFEPPLVPVYPWETVVAEKIHGICKHGAISTRLKDYYDLIAISRGLDLDGRNLEAAAKATFGTRKTARADADSPGLSDAFAKSRTAAWRTWSRSKGLGMTPEDFTDRRARGRTVRAARAGVGLRRPSARGRLARGSRMGGAPRGRGAGERRGGDILRIQ